MSRASADLAAAVAALRAGGLVVYPTETVYGLGAAALVPEALSALLRLKGRDAAKGMSVLVEDFAAAGPLIDAAATPQAASALARALWPGPLTIVVPAAAGAPGALRGPAGGIGLRCSADPLARALVREFGGPVTATSANPSGAPAATDVATARGYFGENVAVYLDGGRREPQSVSTVVEFFERRVILRRAGDVPADAVAALIPGEKLES